jgi:hypothetical protein
MNYFFIADYFEEQCPQGGAEIATEVVINGLKSRGKNVIKVNSNKFDSNILQSDSKLFVCNFMFLSHEAKNRIVEHGNYSIYEHDFKMISTRNPSNYPLFIAPKEHIINEDFYKKADKVIAQCDKHLEIINRNLQLDNLISAKGNPWNNDSLDLLSKLSKVEKEDVYAILNHPGVLKNTVGALEYARSNNIDIRLISARPHKEFLSELTRYKGLIFLPNVFETFSRISFEARCLGLQILGNQNIAFLYEESSYLKGDELIDLTRENTQKIIDIFES